MKHECVAAKIGDDAKDGAEHIANMVKPADKVSADFGGNPLGWHEFWPMTLSRPEPKSCQRITRFIMLRALKA